MCVCVCVCLSKVKENIDSFKLICDNHQHNTRNDYQLQEPFCRLSLTKNWLDSVSLKMFNKLPPCVHQVSLCKFRSSVYNFLVVRPFYDIKEFSELPSREFITAFSSG
ncbi:hypothetical protein J6590_063645 [Homalodisca vitripennis]|nr:hypothetical protein J6590_063645 [Homalodisca vitripennis]